MKTMIMTSIHVFPNCDVDMKVDKLELYNNRKFAALTLENATIFINSREKALEIARALEQAAQELGEEDELDRLCMSDSVLGELQGAVNAVKELDK